MSEEAVQVADDCGILLDARVWLEKHGGDQASVTFESQGGGRNMDYIPAHNLIVSRLSSLSATLLDAIVVSAETRTLDEASRRIGLGANSYPYRLTPNIDTVKLARLLRRGAAEVGRRQGATGPGNRARRIEIRFTIDGLDVRPSLWLDEQLIKPAGAIDVEAVLFASRPRSARIRPSYMQDVEARRAVEQRAMGVAVEELRKRWDRVIDVSATEPFDLLCRSADKSLHVEVKGTTTEGASVVLTKNEVAHARDRYPHVALFVVSRIDLSVVDGEPVATGGTLTQYDPWSVNDFELTPLSFQCHLVAD